MAISNIAMLVGRVDTPRRHGVRDTRVCVLRGCQGGKRTRIPVSRASADTCQVESTAPKLATTLAGQSSHAVPLIPYHVSRPSSRSPGSYWFAGD